MNSAETVAQPGPPRREQFVANVLWNWTGVAVSLFAGLILSPYIIRKLGAEGYGIWSLVFSITGYYNLFDLGFRSAIVRFSAHYRAKEEFDKINELVNTTLAYFSVLTLLLILGTVVLAKKAVRFFDVSSQYHDQFSSLILIVGITWAIGFTFNVFTGCIEGFQRFDISNRISIFTSTIRYLGCAILLYRGYGLVEMGLLSLSTIGLLCLLYAISFIRIFPRLRFSAGLVKLSMLKQVASYGIHIFVAGVAGQSLDQSPSLLIGHYRSVAFVGYYTLPLRLLQYVAEAITRVGIVVAPKATELAAQGKLETVSKLATYANRYSFTLYMPFAMVLFVYGRDIILLWLKEKGPEFALHSAPLLPILVIGIAFATAGQFSSSTVLFGLGKHRGYSWSLVAEALIGIVALIVVLPRFGIMGAAVVCSSLMIVIRGILSPVLVCKHLKTPFLSYMGSIYARPLATALPVLSLTYWMKAGHFSGRNWGELIAVSSIVSALYLGAAFFTCLENEHRQMLVNWMRKRMFPARERSA